MLVTLNIGIQCPENGMKGNVRLKIKDGKHYSAGMRNSAWTASFLGTVNPKHSDYKNTSFKDRFTNMLYSINNLTIAYLHIIIMTISPRPAFFNINLFLNQKSNKNLMYHSLRWQRPISSFLTLVSFPFLCSVFSFHIFSFYSTSWILQVLSAFHLALIFFWSVPPILFPSVLLLQELSHLGLSFYCILLLRHLILQTQANRVKCRVKSSPLMSQTGGWQAQQPNLWKGRIETHFSES